MIILKQKTPNILNGHKHTEVEMKKASSHYTKQILQWLSS